MPHRVVDEIRHCPKQIPTRQVCRDPFVGWLCAHRDLVGLALRADPDEGRDLVLGWLYAHRDLVGLDLGADPDEGRDLVLGCVSAR